MIMSVSFSFSKMGINKYIWPISVKRWDCNACSLLEFWKLCWQAGRSKNISLCMGRQIFQSPNCRLKWPGRKLSGKQRKDESWKKLGVYWVDWVTDLIWSDLILSIDQAHRRSLIYNSVVDNRRTYMKEFMCKHLMLTKFRFFFKKLKYFAWW